MQIGIKSLADESIVAQKRMVTIGSSMSITGQMGPYISSVYEGIFSALYDFNMNSSIDVPYIREYILDDMYLPYKKYENIKFLESKKIYTLLMPNGTANIEYCMPTIREGNVLILFPVTAYQYPDVKNMIKCRASIIEEVTALINYSTEKTFFKRCAIFYQNDLFGIGQKDAAHKVLKEKKIEWIDVPYERNLVSFNEQAEKVLKSDADLIALLCIPSAAFELIRTIKPYKLFNKKMIGTSDLMLGGFSSYVYALGLNFTFSSPAPNPVKSTLQIAKEYRAAMKKHSFKLNMFSLEGYIAAQLFLDAFRAAQYELDNQKIVQHFENMHGIYFKGLLLSFNKERNLSSNVWIVKGPNVDWMLYKKNENQSGSSNRNVQRGVKVLDTKNIGGMKQ
jgi:ABC-type branched-subunit amino acid transport system substrate-binding protein